VTKVLLVEDDESARQVIRENLEAAGIELVEAADGQVGIDLARSVRPDLILDVGLPVLDGWQVAHELLDDASTYEIPLVFLSARTSPADRERGRRLGARDYITKPFDPTALSGRINEILAEAPSDLSGDLLSDTSGPTV
jgi:DNA-binding response OmpR family regulator